MPNSSGLLPPDTTSHGYGGRLALAVVNSIAWRRSADPVDGMNGYDDLVDWVDAAGWLPDPHAHRVLGLADPAAADRAFQHAVALRESLHELFSAVAAGEAVSMAGVREVERWARPGLAGLRLVPGSDTRTMTLHWVEPGLDLPVQQIGVSAALLLADPELNRVKQCPGPHCGWVFYDESRNRSRRWCDPTECGNRDRVQAHYRRTHSA